MTTPAPGQGTADQNSALASLHAALDPFGLGALADASWKSLLNGVPADQVILNIRQSPEYKAAFPGLAAAVANGQISPGAGMEASYRSLENQYRTINQTYGLPAGFNDDTASLGKLIAGGVSPTEYHDRVAAYVPAVMGDKETLNQLGQLYGSVGHTNNPAGDLLAHYLDPTVALPVLTQQYNAAQFAAAAKTAGYGQLTTAQAEQYGSSQGTTQNQAQQGFGTLVHDQQLFTALPGENTDALSQDVQLGAAFGGNATDQEAIANRAKLRVAEGSGGGGFSNSQRGIGGLGSNQV